MPRKGASSFRLPLTRQTDTSLTAAVSDNEESDIDVPDAIPARPKVADDPQEEDDDDEEEAEDEYQVEKILEHKTKNKVRLYRIKWLGYEDELDQTWEPEENLYVQQRPLLPTMPNHLFPAPVRSTS
jgi:hypothetical protein